MSIIFFSPQLFLIVTFSSIKIAELLSFIQLYSLGSSKLFLIVLEKTLFKFAIDISYFTSPDIGEACLDENQGLVKIK
tara:strand:+ start:1083 stop:1316 length:234 start_codon:yes stop_codon:yes gene_type:complete